MELKWASTRKCLSSTFFWDWLGVKCREKTGQGLLPFNFKYIPKAEKLYVLFFFPWSCFAKFGWRKPAESLALVDVGWRQEHIYFLYLPIFTSEALRQTAKPWPCCCLCAGNESAFPSQSFFPAPTRSAPKIRNWVSNADAIKCLLYSRAWIRAVSEPHILHLLIRAQLPPRERNTVKSHYPTSCKHL